MIILGIDPANVTGWAILDGDEIDCGTWRLVVSSEEHPGDRLIRFIDGLSKLRMQHGFQVIAIEDASFGSNNPNTAALHNHLMGMTMWYAAQKSMNVIKCNIASVKKFTTNNGRAEKHEMIAAVNQNYGLKISDNNEADAVAIAKYAEHGLLHGHQPSAAKVRKARRKSSLKQATLFGGKGR